MRRFNLRSGRKEKEGTKLHFAPEWSITMELQFATRMKNYEEGIFQVLNEKKEALLAQGRKVYNLSVGTPDFSSRSGSDGCGGKGRTGSGKLQVFPEGSAGAYRRCDRAFTGGATGVELMPDEIMSVYGSQEGITHVGFTLCDKGGCGAVPDPGYPIFGIGPSLAGAGSGNLSSDGRERLCAGSGGAFPKRRTGRSS